jgi:hypothetical protein
MWSDIEVSDGDKPRWQRKIQKYPNRIGEWMDARGLEASTLGAMLHKHYGTIYKIREGDRIATPYEYLIPISAILGCTMEDLLLPTEENMKLFEEIQASIHTPHYIRRNVAASVVRWNKRIVEKKK